ncbi:polysaccharide lyase family 8 super-sandwich domain-containing protein [Gelidibacter maritimus]|uniref:BNR-4 repeat-containing protein n=1 Tax=Gelidibacter maritimus TaxID=2761487 RepID=A0A7W2M8J3_9FLAO|nr:polysaccharide lyase family 8 super-sandwich domain-containing protein [Gelidibacter maritimus]MBA6154638.1 BNR-4 repeat-containing protein [Gelidibacter maritimus]
MKNKLLFALLVVFLLGNNILSAQEKITVPLTEDGAWSVNSQPSAVYHNGKSYFSWVNSNKSLVAASYNHSTGDYQETVVASSYRGDFASPALLVRENGQILLFASRNEGEAHYFIWVTTSPEDISQWSNPKTAIAYGAGGTLPFAVGDDIYVLYRGKNSVGITYGAGLNSATDQTVNADLASGNRRAGLFPIQNGNDYEVKLDIPYMKAVQDSDGAIHIVFTQLANGGESGNFYAYDQSSIHYMKLVTTSTPATGLSFDLFKADGTTIVKSSIDAGSPPDVIFNEEESGKKAWAYDIQLDGNDQPVVLFDTFNADGTEHVYNQARWDSSSNQWVTSQIADAGDGLHTAAYSANQSRFPSNSFSSGGLNFAANDLSTVYLSKRSEQGVFEIYKYTTSDSGSTWQEAEALTSGTDSNQVNIRPKRIENLPENAPLDIVWMQGEYSSPVDFDTKILAIGNAVTPTAIAFENEEYNLVIDDIETLKVNFSPIFVANKEFTLKSSDGSIVEITSDNKIKGLTLGTVTVTAMALNDPSITATCQVTVLDKLVFDVFKERIVADLIQEKSKDVSQRDADVASYLVQLQSDGAFPDVDYSSTARTDWPPLVHLDRLMDMGLAYTDEESTYYRDTFLKATMDTMLQFWQTEQPSSNNWYYNQIGEPKLMGQYLILMDYLGNESIPEALLNTAIARLSNNGGSPSSQTGANRIDVALHHMYRACLTKDSYLLNEAMTYIYSPIELTTGSEGIQYDNSYTQHGRQLYTGSYGNVFLTGITKASMYAVDTEYAIPSDRLQILSNLVKDSYATIFRGEYMLFNPLGRASTRPNATKKTGDTSIFERMKSLDPANASIYDNVISRLTGAEDPSYGITPSSAHFYHSDYTLHNKPAYTVDLRMVSNRTVRNEYLSDNGEGIKQYFLSDGATGIFVDGDEYYNIFPVWDWSKIPGVTSPEYTSIPQASSYIQQGQSDFVGGVTDNSNTISAYQHIDTYSGINTSANKAWFFFDNEIVCLGNSIQSTSGLKVNTTVNQNLLEGNITVSSGGTKSSMTSGHYDYSNLDWVYHDKVAYYFPEHGNVNLTAQQKTGEWSSINTNYADEPMVVKDVFTLAFDHGVDPTEDTYAYVIVPGVSEAEADTYSISDIEILVNSDSLQAVYHKAQKSYGLVFHKPAKFTNNGFAIEADAGCVVLVKDIDQAETIIHVADPKNGTIPINLGVVTPSVDEAKLITYSASSPHLGQSLRFNINQDSPLYPGKESLLDKSGWIIKTSIEGPSDAVVGGTEPEYIIDDNTQTAFLFVKPGRTFGGITTDPDYEPSFTIDMQTEQDISFFVYRHRTDNSLSILRASSVSFYGSDSEDGPFDPIIEDVAIATDVPEVKVSFPEVSYRYIKLVITGWDVNSGNTIQVSEFNVGNLDNTTLGLEDLPVNASPSEFSVFVYPNPVNSGNHLNFKMSRFSDDVVFEVYDILGTCHQKAKGTVINTAELSSGLYFLKVFERTTNQIATAKFVVK